MHVILPRSLLGCSFCWLVTWAIGPVFGEDWPTLGRDSTRNPVSAEQAGPTSWSTTNLLVPATDRESRDERPYGVRWVADLGSNTYGDPVVAGGLVWVGTNNGMRRDLRSPDDAAVLLALRESDGRRLFAYVSRRLPEGRIHDWPLSSMAGSPLVEEDRLWFVSNRCETICLDIGPLRRGKGPPTKLWSVGMKSDLGVFPNGSRMHMAHLCSPAGYRDWLYVNTGNGVDESQTRVPAPQAPSLICFEKNTGRIVWSDNSPGENLLTGQSSSPTVIEVQGKPQVVMPQGDGWVRSFDAQSGTLQWQFDLNRKEAHWSLNANRGDRRAASMAPPVLAEGRLYVALGLNPTDGEIKGRLCCLDPSKHGDISSELVELPDGQATRSAAERRVKAADTARGERVVANPNSGLIWEFTTAGSDFEDALHGVMGNVAVSRGLAIVCDSSGLVHCFDAQTGQRHWVFDSLNELLGSPLIVDDKVYVGTPEGDLLLAGLSANRDQALRFEAGMYGPLTRLAVDDSELNAAPVFANGVLYLATNRHLFAIDGSTSAQAAGSESPELPRKAPLIRAPHAVFVPTPGDVVQRMLSLAEVGKNDVVYDLGCGDGRIVIAAAKQFGCHAVGVELDPELVAMARLAVKDADVESLVSIEQGDLFEADISRATVVTCYLLGAQMQKLEPMLRKLPAGTRIVAHEFGFETPAAKTEELRSEEDGEQHHLLLYRVPLDDE